MAIKTESDSHMLKKNYGQPSAPNDNNNNNNKLVRQLLLQSNSSKKLISLNYYIKLVVVNSFSLFTVYRLFHLNAAQIFISHFFHIPFPLLLHTLQFTTHALCGRS